MMSDSNGIRERLLRRVTDNALVLFYATLIALCAVYAPVEVIQFIYAGF